MIRADLAGHLVTIDSRQPDIDQRNIGPALDDRLIALDSVGNGRHVVAVELENVSSSRRLSALSSTITIRNCPPPELPSAGT